MIFTGLLHTCMQDIRCQSTTVAATTGLVYADVMPQHVFSVGPDHSATRVEYAELRGHSNELPTHVHVPEPLTTSPDTNIHPMHR